MSKKAKYYLKMKDIGNWHEVSKEEFIRAEQSAGFRSKFGPNEVATGGFGSGIIEGKVEYEKVD